MLSVLVFCSQKTLILKSDAKVQRINVKQAFLYFFYNRLTNKAKKVKKCYAYILI